MGEPTDITGKQQMHAHEQSDNRFLREASPELLTANAERWVQQFIERLERSRQDAADRRCEPNTPEIDQQRLLEARDVVRDIPLTHIVSADNLASIIQSGHVASTAELGRRGTQPTGPANTYEFDQQHGLDEFAFLRLSQQRFRLFGINRAVTLVFDHALLAEPNTFVSFEDIAEYLVRQKYMGQGDAWQTYLKDNFRGHDFPRVASHYIAAAYAKPDDYRNLDRPDYSAHIMGQEQFLTRIPQLPPFEVKVYPRLDLTHLKAVQINMDKPGAVTRLTDLGLGDRLQHDPNMVAWE